VRKVIALQVGLVAEDPAQQGRVADHRQVARIDHTPDPRSLAVVEEDSRGVAGAAVADEGIDPQRALVGGAPATLGPLHDGEEGLAVDTDHLVGGDRDHGGARHSSRGQQGQSTEWSEEGALAEEHGSIPLVMQGQPHDSAVCGDTEVGRAPTCSRGRYLLASAAVPDCPHPAVLEEG